MLWHPSSQLRWQGWDVFASILLMIVLVLMPVAMAFDDINDALFEVNLMMDVCFLIDCVKSFFAG